MTCPLTKAESVDDKLNKTGERLLTELGDLANVSGKKQKCNLGRYRRSFSYACAVLKRSLEFVGRR